MYNSNDNTIYKHTSHMQNANDAKCQWFKKLLPILVESSCQTKIFYISKYQNKKYKYTDHSILYC